tara:strand:+ start:623 stop:1249 length:627 start_codon:yes stop_codon:yes gene_type:complete
MSFNRLDYDKCSYKQEISESIGPGEYQLNTPFISCDDCYNRDPQIIMQRSGASVAKNMPMIDVDSELININRKLSNCSNDSFIPKFNKEGEIDNSIEVVNFKNCDMPTTENTLLSNPPCNLKGTGWNRWEWLCQDPQAKVEIPFDYNISNRMVFKDNHRPVVPNLIDQSTFLPENNDEPIKVNIAKAPAVPLGNNVSPLQFANIVRDL